MTLVRTFLGAFALASLSLAACGPIDARATNEKSGPKEKSAPKVVHLKLVPLDIQTAKGTLHYKVEVAATPDQQSRGLMYRKSLPVDGGMIFPMVPPRFASFWMKNTWIPLDIIFIRPDHSIESIAANAVPEDLTPIESGEPVMAVLELAGGEAAKIGIAPGDKVSW